MYFWKPSPIIKWNKPFQKSAYFQQQWEKPGVTEPVKIPSPFQHVSKQKKGQVKAFWKDKILQKQIEDASSL